MFLSPARGDISLGWVPEQPPAAASLPHSKALRASSCAVVSAGSWESTLRITANGLRMAVGQSIRWAKNLVIYRRNHVWSSAVYCVSRSTVSLS
jgi:hypothetical protein